MHVLSCSPPCGGGSGRRPRTELRAFVSSHIHLSRHCRRSKGVGKRNSLVPAHEAALTNTSVRAPVSATCANICQPNVYMQMLRDRRGESQRRLACLFAFPSLSVCTSPSVTEAIFFFFFSFTPGAVTRPGGSGTACLVMQPSPITKRFYTGV